MNLKLLANQVFLRAKNERANERCVNADEKERSFSFLGMNAKMNAVMDASISDSGLAPFHTDGREFPEDNDADISFCPDLLAETRPQILAAVSWLDAHLLQPRRIGEVCAQWTGGTQQKQDNGSVRWEGGRDGTNGHGLEDLMIAARCIGVTAFTGPDDRFWWTRQPPDHHEKQEAA